MNRRRPLYSGLIEHNLLDRSSFHTPGHKSSGFLPAELLGLDMTELPDTDALFEADGIIRQCEEGLSGLYGTAASFISAGGCSLAIQAMLRAALRSGGRLLCARNAHRSAVNAAALLGLDPVWLYPRGSSCYSGRIEPADVEAALSRYPDITACYITSPSYYGELCDIAAIAEICHKNGAILLVDNAHGSHLAFMSRNMHPIALGADMSACSLHKTMPVMTGGAALNVRTEELARYAKSDMALFASTSPSYVIMSSIDLCVDYMLHGKGKQEYQECEKRVAAIKASAKSRGISLPGGECDPLRICLYTAGCGIVGEKAQLDYFEAHDIDCEFCDGENAVLLCTPFNSERDFSRLSRAIEELPRSGNPGTGASAERVFYKPERIISLREATLSPRETVAAEKAAGRIAADTSCPCPPGVPLVMPGELIDLCCVQQLLHYGYDRISVVNECTKHPETTE